MKLSRLRVARLQRAQGLKAFRYVFFPELPPSSARGRARNFGQPCRTRAQRMRDDHDDDDDDDDDDKPLT